MHDWLARRLPPKAAAVLAGIWYAALIWLIVILSDFTSAGFAYWGI
ncbi:MAG: hypothetical protein VYB54_04480 [Pseudomonadota bacterium]|nr:hypothetical protein [Pseudomonadota bacterium]